MKAQKVQTIVLTAAAIVLFTAVGFTNAQGKGTHTGTGIHGSLFIDANGDGICDNYANRPKDGTGNKYGAGKNTGSTKGNGNGTGVCNGTGQGNGTGTGVCDGTGPKGNGKKGK